MFILSAVLASKAYDSFRIFPRIDGECMPSPDSNDKNADAPVIDVADPASTYRQAARLNRDPFSKESPEKQKLLLLAAAATIAIKLSLLEPESFSAWGFKVAHAERSADSITLVLTTWAVLRRPT